MRLFRLKVRRGFISFMIISLVFSLVLPGLATAASLPATNPQGSQHWAQKSIERWQSSGIVKGYEDGSLRPNDFVTRAELVMMLNKLAGYYMKSDQQFQDVASTAWYADAFSIARQAGYFKGFPDNMAKADAAVTRQDAMTLIAKVWLAESDGRQSEVNFKDQHEIKPYAKNAVQALNGIVSGYPDGTFRPGQPMTRAEVFILFDKMMSAYYAKEGSIEAGYIQGNAVINRSNVTLKNTTIEGKLYLTAGIADGDVLLDEVAVEGKTYISGGGIHTITAQDSNLSDVIVNRLEGKVRLLAKGNSAIQHIHVESASIIELEEGASAAKVVINQPSTIIIHEGASITSLLIGKDARGTAIQVQGSIDQLVIEAQGVTVNGQEANTGSFTIKGGVIVPSTVSSNDSGSVSSGGSSATPSLPPGDNGTGNNPGSPVNVDLVDSQASTATRSLFAYLQDIRGKQILFGHQHDTTVSFARTDNNEVLSDVYNAVGEYPAVFGWDTLSLEGRENPPGVAGDLQASREGVSAAMKDAYQRGGIVTLSTHPYNFVTGGDFNDTKGSVVPRILPGGDKNDELNGYLDIIAEFAHGLKDDKGNLIPVLFRPFHEQNGGWFWWGAQTTSASDYIELYRYTVEYLRDIKGVRNFLYVYSPNGTFGGNEATYLTTYPGDEYVDVLGMDQYDNKQSPGTEGFLNGLVNDLGMISKLADRKGKIATLSEYGYSAQGMHTTGNADLEWFTKVLNAIKADPEASRIAYMLTWANFNLNGNLFVPYHNAPGLGDHELLDDFIAFYNDPYTAFAGDVKNAYDRNVQTKVKQPYMHIVTPTNHSSIKESPTTIRARVLNIVPSQVTYIIEGTEIEVPMELDADGYYSAVWSPDAVFNGKTADITVKVYTAGGAVLEQTVTAFVKVNDILIKEYTFDLAAEADSIQNNGTWSGLNNNDQSMELKLEHAQLDGNGKLRLNVTGLEEADSWQELKLELSEIASQVSLQAVSRVQFEALVPLDAGAAGTLRSIVQLPPDWDTKYGMTTTEQQLSDLEVVTADGQAYGRYHVQIDLNNPQKSAEATGLAISLVGSALNGDQSIFIDNLRLYSVYVEAETDPALIDDFESYQGSNELLSQKYIPAGDATNVSLTASHKSGGSYAMKLEYTLAGSGYAGRIKNLGRDWSDYNKLKFWMVPDGSNQNLTIQLKVGGVYFEAYPSLASTEGEWVEIHFNEFEVVHWDTPNLGKKLNKISLQNVEHFAIYVNAVNGATLTSTLYFDDIKAIDDGTGGVPNGGSGPGSTPEKAGILYDFEEDADGWVVESNNANAAFPVISTDEAASGSHSLSTNFSLTGTDFELAKNAPLDLSAVDTLQAKVKLSAGASAKARLYVKTGTAYEWFDSGAPIQVGADSFVTLSMDLSTVSNRHAVVSMGIKIEDIAGAGGTATVYLDEVSLLGGQIVPEFYFGFESSEEGWAINNDANGSYNTALADQVSVTDAAYSEGVKSLKADFVLNGGQFQLRSMDSVDLSSFTKLSADLKLGSLVPGVTAELFIQTGSGWEWAATSPVELNGTDFATLTLDLSTIAARNQVMAIGMQILTPVDGTESPVVIYLDHVRAE